MFDLAEVFVPHSKTVKIAANCRVSCAEGATSAQRWEERIVLSIFLYRVSEYWHFSMLLPQGSIVN